MATQEILVNYKADVEQLTGQLNKVAAAQDKVSDSAAQTSKDVKQSTITQEQAAKKRIELLKKEEAELKRLQAARKLAFDPKVIADFDRKIAASQQKIALLGRQSTQALSGVAGQIKSIGAGIAAGLGAAFTVDAIINFGRASVNAFLEAEENANRLKFAITTIGTEGEEAFEKLIRQSERLQKTTIFSDDSVQNAQTILATVGLTSDQIERAIPVIADFAAATKQDIGAAAQAFTGGLQGMGREFKRFGADLSANKTSLENYDELLRALSSTSGAAAEATKTLTGQLKQQENAVDDLQEKVGEGLAPAWVAVKKATFEATLAIIDYFKAGGNLALSLFQKQLDDVPPALEEVTEKVNQQQKALEEAGFSESEARKNAIRDIRAEIVERLALRIEQAKAIQNSKDATIEEKQLAATRIGGVQNELKAIQQLAAAQKSREEDAKRALSVEFLRSKSLEELNLLLRENEKLNDITSQSNVDLINREITARKKQTEELEKELAKQLEALKKLNGDAQKIPPIELKVKLVPDEVVTVNPVPDKIEDRDGIKEADDGIKKIEEQTELLRDQQQQLLSESQSLLGSLTDLYRVYTDTRLQQINEELNAELDALDIQEKEVQKNLDKRRISETEAERTTELLLKQRVEAEKRAADKEREIKRKQAILDKANALIQITINTAQGVSKALAQAGPLGIALAALIAAAGAAQAAVVVSQPIAYRKGSKDTGAKDHMALVGEEGPEYVMMPAHAKVLPAPQTKTYGEALEAMRRKQFDTYVSEKYVTPALVAQKKQDEKTRRKSFAENLAQSITYNTISQSTQKKLQDVSVTNVDALARGIARELKTDIYRR